MRPADFLSVSFLFMVEDCLFLQERSKFFLPKLMLDGGIPGRKGLPVHVQHNHYIIPVFPVDAVGINLCAVNTGNFAGGGKDFLNSGKKWKFFNILRQEFGKNIMFHLITQCTARPVSTASRLLTAAQFPLPHIWSISSSLCLLLRHDPLDHFLNITPWLHDFMPTAQASYFDVHANAQHLPAAAAAWVFLFHFQYIV